MPSDPITSLTQAEAYSKHAEMWAEPSQKPRPERQSYMGRLHPSCLLPKGTSMQLKGNTFYSKGTLIQTKHMPDGQKACYLPDVGVLIGRPRQDVCAIRAEACFDEEGGRSMASESSCGPNMRPQGVIHVVHVVPHAHKQSGPCNNQT